MPMKVYIASDGRPMWSGNISGKIPYAKELTNRLDPTMSKVKRNLSKQLCKFGFTFSCGPSSFVCHARAVRNDLAFH